MTHHEPPRFEIGTLYFAKRSCAPGSYGYSFPQAEFINEGIRSGDILMCVKRHKINRRNIQTGKFEDVEDVEDVWFYNLTKKTFFLLERGEASKAHKCLQVL